MRTIKRQIYKAFGLTICSEFSLPELSPFESEIGRVDVVIEVKDLTQIWNELLDNSTRKFIVTDRMVMFRITDTAIFSVLEGEKIIVSPIEKYDEGKLRLYILGTCMGALLMQRKILPLHGSAIAINGKAYAFIGNSGVGKSTLASAFLKKGYELISDDVIPVSVSERGIPFVTPSYPQQKLWEESIHAFGMNTMEYSPLFERETKYAVPVSSRFINEPLPLTGLFELVKGEEMRLHSIKKLERFRTMFYHTYRNFLIGRLGLLEWHFQLCANIVNQIDMFQLQRPNEGFTANELVDVVLDSIRKGEKE
ncbi:aldolase [Bacillus manliponensis]|uniref:aldolase n=1 Tax=Bacillus manliponensis TaxID=574376 RepID=UPI0035135DDF